MVVRAASGPGRLSPGGRRLYRRKWFLALLLLGVVAAALYAARSAWLAQLGTFLVRTDTPEPAEIAVVLAGDHHGYRIMKAAELVREGYAPRVLVDGPLGFYGISEAALAIDFAVRQGAPREIFDPFPIESDSTLHEAQLVDAELRRRGIRTALVVTSNYHTRRARFIFHRYASGDVAYRFIASYTEDFDPLNWWRSRAGQKVLVTEYIKSLHSWFE